MSLGAVNGALSSLKSCQADLNTGMDIVTDLAMDLTEAKDGGDHPDTEALKAMMLECAKLDREINCFVDSVQQVTAGASIQEPEAMFSLSDKVKEHFTQTVTLLPDTDLSNHHKVVAFYDSIRSSTEQANIDLAENVDLLNQDIAVTQSQVNFTCPLTQVEMVNPVKNKKCNHHYGREAIMDLIRTKHKQKKHCRCPVIGCGNSNVLESDLVPDQMLRRKIQNHMRSNS